jgi:hypothetical protein
MPGMPTLSPKRAFRRICATAAPALASSSTRTPKRASPHTALGRSLHEVKLNTYEVYFKQFSTKTALRVALTGVRARKVELALVTIPTKRTVAFGLQWAAQKRCR